MKVVLVNKSDATGGAAVVSYRLMEALRGIGVDARMLVAEKLTDSPYISTAASSVRLKYSFLAERLRIFVENGFDRKSLFKIDTAYCGVDISRHPWVREADAVLLNWVNQGLLSLADIERLAATGKRIVWTMHDMWCMTGVCHHAGVCAHYRDGSACRDCPLMRGATAHRTWERKRALYERCDIRFVAVSRWLAGKARESGLLGDQRVEVIGNAFSLGEGNRPERSDRPELRVLFGAARLDDPIKGWPRLMAALRVLADRYPDVARRVKLVTFGEIRDAALLEEIPVRHEHLGRISASEIAGVYRSGDIVVSASEYETLPGTLVEGQAYGCVPVAFDAGGQRDIIDHKRTGYIATAYDVEDLAAGIVWAAETLIDERGDQGVESIFGRMRRSVEEKFSADVIARRYLDIIGSDYGV
ncbi:MAG: glycosyltransferase [Muribaculaceae bacterium]|nr:glycosyltransferase [Muribaculaceae bacterium]